MEIVCVILAVLLVLAIRNIIDLNDRIKRMTKSYKNLAADSKYDKYQMQTMIDLRDHRVEQQKLTIKRLENEKNTYNKPQV